MRSGSERKMKVLLFSTVFPNAAQPHHGVFVRERMRGLPEDVEVRVVAPTAWFPFISGLRPGFRPAVPAEEIQDGVPVFHPRFLSFPGILKCLDGLLLFLWTFPLLRRLHREHRFDAIDAHFTYPEGFAAAARRKAPESPRGPDRAGDSPAPHPLPPAPAAAPVRPPPRRAGDRRLRIAAAVGRRIRRRRPGAGDRQRHRPGRLPAGRPDRGPPPPGVRQVRAAPRVGRHARPPEGVSSGDGGGGQAPAAATRASVWPSWAATAPKGPWAPSCGSSPGSWAWPSR